MSVIRVHVEDQVLRIIEAPTIASGGQNEVKVAFTFCEKWDGFSKTATFQQGDGNVYYSVLNEDDICVIPWEVCYDAGTFYIGVFGEKDNVRRTTTVVKYKVQRGSIYNESVPSAPSPEVYDQIMSVFADAKAEQERFMAEVNTVMTASVEAVNQTNDNVNRFVQEMTEAKENGEFKGEKGDPYELTQEDKDGIADMVLTAPEIKKIMDDIAELKYVPIDITSITNNVGTKELGSSVDSVTISWTVNKEPMSQTVQGESVDVTERSKTIPGPFTTGKSFTVTATDEKGKTDSESTSISFVNGVYYGVLEDGAEVDSNAILTLTRKLQSSKGLTFTANAGATQRIVYALPTRYGTPNFKVGGFDGGFSLVKTFNFTNASGYTESYDVWMSDNVGLGSTNVTVS